MKGSSLSLWCMMMAAIVAAASATLTWTVDSDPKTYSSFLDSLREKLSRGTSKRCNIPVTDKNNNQKFVLANLVLPFNGNTITFAFRASDAYLVGFQDRDSKDNKLRANFFSDEYKKFKDNYKRVFADAENLGPALPCAGSYIDLQGKAELGRDKINLGVPSLQSAIKEVYGKDFNAGKDITKKVAKFALVSIQMVAEAARFKYIEEQVKEHGMRGSFQTGGLIKDLENNWSKISNAYHESCKPTNTGFSEKEMNPGLLQYKKVTGLNSNDSQVALAFI